MARPIMVAVGGDSGTGKAALCAGLRAIFGDERCCELHLDGYFALNRAQRNALGWTPLDPRTHAFAAMDDALWELADGGTVTAPVYDHDKGDVAGTRTVAPREIVLVQGRFPLYTHALRSLFDVGVWLEREADLALKFTVHREIGGAAGEHRRADYATYLAPQAKHAEVCVRFTRPGVTIAERGRPELNVDVADEARVRALEAELGSGSRPARLGAYAGAGGEGTSAALGLAQLVVARHVEWAAARRAEAGAE
jgi:phosphoribulokinase